MRYWLNKAFDYDSTFDHIRMPVTMTIMTDDELAQACPQVDVPDIETPEAESSASSSSDSSQSSDASNSGQSADDPGSGIEYDE